MNKTTSIWKTTAPEARFSSLTERINTDVAIVGAGITGLTTAWLLAREGKKVCVLEAAEVAGGTSGKTSAHLNTQIDFGYAQVLKKFGQEKARKVAASREYAIDFIEKLAGQIPCDFRRMPGYLYAENPAKAEELSYEYEASQKAGLPVQWKNQTGLPFDITGAVEYPAQAHFNPQKYLNGLAEKINSLPDCQVFTHSRVRDFDRKSHTLATDTGKVTADEVIFATHYPLFINPVQPFAYPYRSYMVTAKVTNAPEPALYWDMAEPYHYTTVYENGEGTHLLVGGADNKTGQQKDSPHPYQDLNRYIEKRYQVEARGQQWSSQFYEPADGLPYIGKTPFSGAHIATGFSGDGMVYGTLAGEILADKILGNKNSFGNLYDANRFEPLASGENFVKGNMEVAVHLVKDWLSSEDLKDIKPGEGRVVQRGTKKLAVSMDASGGLTALSAVCPHMGCIVAWNAESKSWDCPCHGSRFEPDGEVLNAPATHGLKREQP